MLPAADIKDRAGFTVIELLLTSTIAIITIAGAGALVRSHSKSMVGAFNENQKTKIRADLQASMNCCRTFESFIDGSISADSNADIQIKDKNGNPIRLYRELKDVGSLEMHMDTERKTFEVYLNTTNERVRILDSDSTIAKMCRSCIMPLESNAAVIEQKRQACCLLEYN